MLKALKLKNKRGDATSLIVALVVIFVIALVALLAGKVIPQVMSVIKLNPAIATNNNSVSTLTMVEEHTIPWLDYLVLFTFIASVIGLIISSMYIDTHPALMVIFIIMLVITIIFSGIFANAYTTMGETSALTATYNQFTSTRAIFEHLPMILFVVGLLVIIILYGKSKNVYVGGQGV